MSDCQDFNMQNLESDNMNYAALNFKPKSKRNRRPPSVDPNVIYAATKQTQEAPGTAAWRLTGNLFQSITLLLCFCTASVWKEILSLCKKIKIVIKIHLWKIYSLHAELKEPVRTLMIVKLKRVQMKCYRGHSGSLTGIDSIVWSESCLFAYKVTFIFHCGDKQEDHP